MQERDIRANFLRGETLFPLFMILFIGVLFYDALQAPPRPMILPRSVQLIVLVLLFVQFFKSLLAKRPPVAKSAEEGAVEGKIKWKLFVTFVGMILIPFASYLIGYIPTCCIYVLLTILYWGGSKIHHIIIAEVLVVGLIYGVFVKILDVIFPVGWLFGG